MKFVKVDPITGNKVSSGTCPDSEVLPEVDHEGLMVFAYEGELTDYQFDRVAMTLVRIPEADVFDLRRRLAEEKRPPTQEELKQLGLA